MENEVIETRVARIWLDQDGILHNVILPNAMVMLEDAKEISNSNAEVAEGKKIVGLVDARNVKSATREARKFAARDETKTSRAAIAILVGSPLSRVIGNFFISIDKPPYPTRPFTSETEAIEWLKGFLE
jgi:hypothetical protein